MVDVVHPRDDTQWLLIEPSPESAQHRACLCGVSRTGYERKRQAIKRRKRSRRKSRPSYPRLTRPPKALDQALECCVCKCLLVAMFGQHHRGVLQLPADARAGPEDP